MNYERDVMPAPFRSTAPPLQLHLLHRGYIRHHPAGDHHPHQTLVLEIVGVLWIQSRVYAQVALALLRIQQLRVLAASALLLSRHTRAHNIQQKAHC